MLSNILQGKLSAYEAKLLLVQRYADSLPSVYHDFIYSSEITSLSDSRILLKIFRHLDFSSTPIFRSSVSGLICIDFRISQLRLHFSTIEDFASTSPLVVNLDINKSRIYVTDENLEPVLNFLASL